MTQAQKLPFPQVGEIFELTTNTELSGLDLLDYCEFEPKKQYWESTAPTIPAGTTKRFKLVRVGKQGDFYFFVSACRAQGGKETNGLWIKVFKDTFGSGHDPVGVPHVAWCNTGGILRHTYFPVLGVDGYLRMSWSSGERDKEWFRLVEVDE